MMLLAPPVLFPAATVTPTEACRWLTARTNRSYAVAPVLRDYPVFLSVQAGVPARVEGLLARALAGRWEADGRTLRLVPERVGREEGRAAFAARWRAATAGAGAWASLPPGAAEGMRVGDLRAFSAGAAPETRPLDAEAARAFRRGLRGEPMVFLRQVVAGRFEASVAEMHEDGRSPGPTRTIPLAGVPPEARALLGAAAARFAFPDAERNRIWRVSPGAMAKGFDWRSVDRADPLAAFYDLQLRGLAAAVDADVALALPDLVMGTLFGRTDTTLGTVLEGLGAVDEISVEDGALVGRLSAQERRDPTQPHRRTVAALVASHAASRTLSLGERAAFMAGEPMAANEAGTDVGLLSTAGFALGAADYGDLPFNVRLAAAIPEVGWARLRAGGALRLADMPVGAQAALRAMLAHAPVRATGEGDDPTQAAGYAAGRLLVRARFAEEPELLAESPDGMVAMGDLAAGYAYEEWKKALGREPRYRPVARRSIALTIDSESGDVGYTTRLSDGLEAATAPAGPWRALPEATRRRFEGAMATRRREG